MLILLTPSSVQSEILQVGSVELASHETLVLETKDLPKGWAVASDPELVKLGNTWWMFFNSLQLDRKRDFPIHILAASLPPGKPLDSERTQWTVHAYPVISPGPEGSWDDHTTETPKFVYGYDATAKRWVGRLYYLGWRVINKRKGKKDYRIGFAQWDGAKWKKQGNFYPKVTLAF